jgi:hypothetical protein
MSVQLQTPLFFWRLPPFHTPLDPTSPTQATGKKTRLTNAVSDRLVCKKTAIHNGCWPGYISTDNRIRNSDNIRIADTVLCILGHLGSHVRLNLSRYGVL